MARRTRVTAIIDAEDRASSTFGKVESRFTRLGNSVRRNALKITAALGSLTLAFRALDRSARLESQTAALRLNLGAQGIALDGFLDKLKEVSAGTVSTANLIESSSRALLLGIPAEEIANLLDIARVSSIATGESVAKAFDDIATGIGRASPLILDNLGIVVKLGPAYEAYASSVGKSAEELTPLEQKQALLNEVLRVGAGRIETFGEAQGELALRLQQSTAAARNFQDAAGRLGSVVALGLGALVTRAASGFVLLARGIVLVTGEIARLASALPVVGTRFGEIADDLRGVDSRLGTTARAMKETADAMSEGADIAGSALLGLSDDAQQAVDGVEAIEGAANSAGASMGRLGIRAGQLGTKLGEVGDSAAVVGSEFESFRDTLKEALENLQPTTESVTLLSDAFEELGQESNRSIVDGLDKAKDALDRIERGFRDGVVSLNAYKRAQEAFNLIEEEGERRLKGTTAEINAQSEALRRLSQELENNTNAKDRNNRTGSGSGSSQLISTQFGQQGTFTFRNGRRVFVTPDGRIIP